MLVQLLVCNSLSLVRVATDSLRMWSSLFSSLEAGGRIPGHPGRYPSGEPGIVTSPFSVREDFKPPQLDKVIGVQEGRGKKAASESC